MLRATGAKPAAHMVWVGVKETVDKQAGYLVKASEVPEGNKR